MEGSDLLTAGVLFLFAAVAAVPLASRLGIGPVLGYLLAGIAIGPWGLGFISDVDEILHFSELGVVFLMFIIGLELSPAKLWQLRRSIFGVGAALTFLLMLFFSPRNSPSFFAQPGWQLLGGVLGPVYVVILTIATPTIGIALTMIGILAGQVFKSLIIDHFGLLGTPHRKINARRIVALVFIIAALVLVAKG